MDRFGDGPRELCHDWTPGLNVCLPGDDTVAVQRNFERRHIDQIAESKPLGLSDERLVHNRKLRNAFGYSCQSLGITAGRHDAHVFLRIDTEPAKR